MKKWSKRTISMIVVCLLLLTMLPVSALAASWRSHWSAGYVQTASDKGWVQEDGAISAAEPITRGEFAIILWHIVGSPEATGACPFTDVTGDELTQAVTALYDQEIIQGIDATTFAPEDTLIRQHGLAFLARAFGLEAKDPKAAANFTDWADVETWAQDAIAALVEKGIVSGVGNNCLAPNNVITLGEVCKVAVLAQGASAVSGTLKAGAGNGEIIFEKDMFPVEGFNGVIHDNPYARVLVMDDGTTRTAIAAVELVNIPADGIELCQKVISEKTGTPVENVWVHATHAITTPHGPRDEAQLALYMKALEAAITEASEEAAASFQPAVAGIDTGYCDVNANRDIELNGEQYYGLGSTEPSNKQMTIVRFNSLDGDPIGFFISYGIKPTAIDNSEMGAETRQISSDVPGLACRLMEEEFGAPALFCMPAAGDQIPKETALFYEVDENGEVPKDATDIGVEAGIEIVDRLGTEMGETAIEIAQSISCTDSTQVIHIQSTILNANSTDRDGNTEVVEVPISAIAFGDDLAFVGFQPELNCTTELQLWEKSPYAHTLLISFMNGENKYMPDDHGYEVGSWEYKRTSYERGTAEKFVDAAANLLKDIKGDSTAVGLTADAAIKGVSTIGFVDTDGAKVSTIVVEYNVDLTGANVSTDSFEVNNYGTAQGDGKCEIGSNPGIPLKAYINDKPEASANGGSGSGRYVIIEVNTDYQLSGVPKYTQSMIADVLQTATLRTDSYTITPSTEKVTNYIETVSSGGQQGGAPGGQQGGAGGAGGPGGNSGPTKTAIDGKYTITNTEGFQLFTIEDGTAFHATDCWEELDGTDYAGDDHLADIDLPYALYVPADYDDSKSYALVLQIHDAGAMGTDPMITLTESQGSVNFASAEVQQIVKDAWGLDGMIVVSPQFEDAIRTTRDNWSLSAGVPATWQLLDYLTEKYSIDMDHIYGTGQSMGGMQVVAMAAQRDNYFAGVWANGCQWGTNYNLEEPYSSRGSTQTNKPAPADGTIIWTKDADGNEVDYRNWFYLISDDNVLITNCQGDVFSTNTWKELDFLYQDLAGAEPIPQAVWNPLAASKDEQNAAMNNLAAQESDRGFYWTAFEGGNHMATWIYSHGVFAHYQWLLTQSRDDEMAREKLPLDKPFVAAEEQIQTEDRLLAPDADGNDVYFVTGEAGAGTADYNSSWTQMGTTVLKEPNWKPAE